MLNPQHVGLGYYGSLLIGLPQQPLTSGLLVSSQWTLFASLDFEHSRTEVIVGLMLISTLPFEASLIAFMVGSIMVCPLNRRRQE